MAKSKVKDLLYKIMLVLLFFIRGFTAWYVTLLWGFSLPYFIGGESFAVSMIIGLVSGYFSYKVWRDFDQDWSDVDPGE